MKTLATRSKLLLMVVLPLLGCVMQVHGQTSSNAIPFSFTSRGTPYGVQGDFAGTYSIEIDSIQVTLTKATIYVSDHCPYQGRSSINTISFGLRAPTLEGKWKIETQARPIAVVRIMSPREEYVLEALTFRIPRKPDIDLSKRRLVAVLQVDAIEDVDDRPGSGYVYAFGPTFLADKIRVQSNLD